MKRKTTKSSAFSKLKAGLEDAVAYHRGARAADRARRRVEAACTEGCEGAGPAAGLTGRIRANPQREPADVQAWETNARRPSDAALKLLSVAKKNPQVLLG